MVNVEGIFSKVHIQQYVIKGPLPTSNDKQCKEQMQHVMGEEISERREARATDLDHELACARRAKL
jgi:hypothetical protein